MRSLRRLLAVPALVAGVVACDDDENTGPAPEQFTAALSGAAERPVIVNIPGSSGAASFAITPGRIDYTLDATGLTGITQAHIHAGGTAVAGPVVATLLAGPPTVTSGRIASGSLTPTSTALASGVTLDSVIKLIRDTLAYVNVHTQANQPGAIRGHILTLGSTKLPTEKFTATMNGANERPAVTSTAAGTADFEIRGNMVAYTINITSPIDSVTAGHIHRGDPSISGPVALDLLKAGWVTTARQFTGTLKADSNNAIATAVVPTLDSLFAIMRNGNSYANIHTRRVGSGEIRGQLVPVNKNTVRVP